MRQDGTLLWRRLCKMAHILKDLSLKRRARRGRIVPRSHAAQYHTINASGANATLACWSATVLSADRYKARTERVGTRFSSIKALAVQNCRTEGGTIDALTIGRG
jgi:hypothetical protein